MPVLNSRSSDYSVAFGKGDYSELFFTSSRVEVFLIRLMLELVRIFQISIFLKLNKKG